MLKKIEVDYRIIEWLGIMLDYGNEKEDYRKITTEEFRIELGKSLKGEVIWLDTSEERKEAEYIKIRDELMTHSSNKERRSVLFNWIKRDRITENEFDKLLYYIK